MGVPQNYTPSPFFDARKPRHPALINFRAINLTGVTQNIFDFTVILAVGAFTLASEPIHNMMSGH